MKGEIPRKNQPNRRKKNIKFAVGMIVKHSYLHRLGQAYLPAARINNHGVIIGWHFKCKRKLMRNSLYGMIPHLSLCELNGHKHICVCKCRIFGTPKIFNQPHYIILADNNKICYVPQSM